MRSVLTRSGVPLALVAVAAFVTSLLPTATPTTPQAADATQTAAAGTSSEREGVTDCPPGQISAEEFLDRERRMKSALGGPAADSGSPPTEPSRRPTSLVRTGASSTSTRSPSAS
ncbi:MAG: hypothetical protein KY469_20605 [Actinobacteria bacterium]|nr:hypothetical protein [Actinomycetota bacterium]